MRYTTPNVEETDPDVMSPEEIARTLAAMDQVEPFDLTDAEHEARQCQRQAAKEREKALFPARADRLRTMWE